MTILTVLEAPDPRLSKPAKPVSVVDDEIRRILDDLLGTITEDGGIGLAATQAGIDKRLLVIDLKDDIRRDPEAEKGITFPLLVVNPEIIEKSEETILYQEGCLSVPDIYVNVKRHKAIKVRYLDYHGNEVILDLKPGVLCYCFQHEMDHLDGITLVDHMSNVKRTLYFRKIRKQKQKQKRKSASGADSSKFSM